MTSFAIMSLKAFERIFAFVIMICDLDLVIILAYIYNCACS
jgi:hypothetical protein